MSYVSEKTEKLKTKRITSLPIINKAKKLRLVQHFDFAKNHKNIISKYIHSQRHFLLTAENIKILKSHSKKFKIDELSAWEVQAMFHSILDFYKNWLDKLTSNNKFFIQKKYIVTYYMKNVTSRAGHIFHIKGDFKSKELVEKSTNITQLMNWMIYVDEEQVHNIFRKNKWQTGTLFFEFYGPQSFAGFHEENDDFKVYLIDSHIGKIGFLHPKDYLKAFEDSIEMAHFLKIGKFNKPFLDEVKNGQLEGMTFEGVIGKSSNRNKLIRCKAKSQAWLSRLKDKCGDDEQLFEKLA